MPNKFDRPSIFGHEVEMKIKFSSVGQPPEKQVYRIIEMETVPREGEPVHFGADDSGDDFELTVRTVVYYPDEPEFDVYVVVGNPRPRRDW